MINGVPSVGIANQGYDHLPLRASLKCAVMTASVEGTRQLLASSGAGTHTPKTRVGRPSARNSHCQPSRPPTSSSDSRPAARGAPMTCAASEFRGPTTVTQCHPTVLSMLGAGVDAKHGESFVWAVNKDSSTLTHMVVQSSACTA